MKRYDLVGWRDSVICWLAICNVAEGEQEECDCIRSLSDLMQFAPSDVRALIGLQLCTSELDALLQSRAVESAAARMVQAAPFGYLMSQAFDGPAVCTVSLPGSEQEHHFTARSAALVKLGAVIKAIVTITSDGEIPDPYRTHSIC